MMNVTHKSRHASSALIHSFMFRAALLVTLFIFGAMPLPAAAQAPVNFEKDWAELITAAKKEGTLVFSIGALPDYQSVLDAFTRKYEIRIQTDGGSGSARATRVMAEFKAGKRALDIGSFSAASTTRRLGPAGALAEIPPILIHPDVLDLSKWYGGRHWYLDAGDTKTVFNYSVRANSSWTFWYNTEKLSNADVASLKSPSDFLDPKWRGKMVDQSWGDPGRLGGMLETYFAPDAGPDWVRKYLTEMNVAFTSDPRLEETWLMRGRNPLSWDEGDIGDALRKLRGVMPIKQVFLPRQQGVLDARSSECCIVVFKEAPHPNAAKHFLNWFLTKEGQTFVHDIKPSRRYTSLREDVPPLNTIESARREPGRDYTFRDFDPNYLSKEDEARDFIVKAYQDGQAQKR